MTRTVDNNLHCLKEMLQFNLEHNILFFRITSDLIPFASHPVCKFNWQDHFKEEFKHIGDFIRKHDMRLSMHPDQFILINSPDKGVLERSIKELDYHQQVLDLMGLDNAAKIQIHVGGVYNDKNKSMERFKERYHDLDKVKERLIIENDDRNYSLKDCIDIHSKTGIPLLFDVFHHGLNNNGETIKECFDMFSGTWKNRDGLPMVDYSSQQSGKRQGKHSESIDPEDFGRFLEESRPFDFDIMLEIKDKEKSALKALEIASGDERLIQR